MHGDGQLDPPSGCEVGASQQCHCSRLRACTEGVLCTDQEG